MGVMCRAPGDTIAHNARIIIIFIPGQSRDKNNKLIALIDARHDIRLSEIGYNNNEGQTHSHCLDELTLSRGEY